MRMFIPHSLGILLLGIWLILMGAVPLLDLSSPALSMAMSILAIVAGVVLILKRS